MLVKDSKSGRIVSKQEIAHYNWRHYEDYKYYLRETYGVNWQFMMTEEENKELSDREQKVDWSSL